MKRRYMATAVIAALALLVAAPSFLGAAGRAEKTSAQGTATGTTVSAPSPQAMAEATRNLESIQYSFREVARKVLPTVVEVDVTEQLKQSNRSQNPFDWFCSSSRLPAERSAGDWRESM